LPARVGALESQIVQLRTEMRQEFSAIRAEMITKESLAAEFDRRDLVTRLDLKLDLERFATRDDLARTNRRIRYGFRDLKTQMLSLHEDLVERLKRLGDAAAAPKRRGARKRR
jgi:hypothetical protein